MTAEIIPFNFESTASTIRVVEIDGEPWFVAKDVAEALEYVWNGTDCIRHVPGKWRGGQIGSDPLRRTGDGDAI